MADYCHAWHSLPGKQRKQCVTIIQAHDKELRRFRGAQPPALFELVLINTEIWLQGGGAYQKVYARLRKLLYPYLQDTQLGATATQKAPQFPANFTTYCSLEHALFLTFENVCVRMWPKTPHWPLTDSLRLTSLVLICVLLAFRAFQDEPGGQRSKQEHSYLTSTPSRRGRNSGQMNELPA